MLYSGDWEESIYKHEKDDKNPFYLHITPLYLHNTTVSPHNEVPVGPRLESGRSAGDPSEQRGSLAQGRARRCGRVCFSRLALRIQDGS